MWPMQLKKELSFTKAATPGVLGAVLRSAIPGATVEKN
jgi:hypothetical protein